MLVSLLQTSMVPLKGFMLEVWSPLAFVVQGLRKNLFGLGCPFYCTSPSWGALLAAFLLGLVLGVGFCAWILYRFDLVPVVASAPSQSPSVRLSSSSLVGRARSALLGYLHETSHDGETEATLDLPVVGVPALVADLLQHLSGFPAEGRLLDCGLDLDWRRVTRLLLPHLLLVLIGCCP